MNAEQEKWVRTLETTTRKRGHNHLHRTKENSFCCLGIYAADSKCESKPFLTGSGHTVMKYDDDIYYLSDALTKKLGLRTRQGHFKTDLEFQGRVFRAISEMNDKLSLEEYPTFKEIAQFIRENEQYIFVQEK